MTALDQSIALAGCAAKHMGLVVWNADGSGPEPERARLSFRIPIEDTRMKRYCYLASPDYGGIDPDSPGGLRGVRNPMGFQQFKDVLRDDDIDLSDLVMRVPIVPATEDRGYRSFENDTGGVYLDINAPTVLELRREKRIRFPGKNVMSIYLDAESGYTTTTSWTRFARMENVSQDSSQSTRRAAVAFLQDVGSSKVGLALTNMIIRADLPFSGNGRVDGIRIDVEGRLQVVK